MNVFVDVPVDNARRFRHTPNMAAYGTTITHSKLRELAVAAKCDPRTMASVLRGEKGGSVHLRLACEKVLREAGLLQDDAAKESQATETAT